MTSSTAPGTTQWQQFPTPGSLGAVAADGAGHFVIERVSDNSGVSDYSLDQFDSATGSRTWTKAIYASDVDTAGLLGAASDGSIYVRYGDGSNARLGRLGPDGAQQWSESLPDLWVAGVASGGDIVIAHSADAPGSAIGELTMYDSSGGLVWSEALPPPTGSNSLRVSALAVDSYGATLVAAQATGTFSWQGHAFGPADQTPVLLKLSSGGALLWSHEFDGLTGDFKSLGTSSAGTVVALMDIQQGSAAFGSDSIETGLDVVVVNSDGSPRWAKNLTSSTPLYGAKLAVDPAGEVSITWAHDTTGCTTELRELNLAGDSLWSRQFNESSACSDAPMNPGVAVGTNHEVALAGMFSGSADFGLGVTSSSSPEGFLLGIANGPPDQNTGSSSGTGAVVAVIKFDGSDGQGSAPDVEDLDGTGSYSTDPNVWITACHWEFGDGTNSSDCWVEHTYSNAGTYHPTLTVTGSDGSTSSASVEVDVTDSSGGMSGGGSGTAGGNGSVVAVVQFDGSKGQGAAPDVEDLDGTSSYSTDPNVWIAACHWDFGDGMTSNDCWVEHTYSSAGTYHPTLTVTGSDGSTSSANVEVDVTAN